MICKKMNSNWVKKNKVELIILSLLGVVFNIAVYLQMHEFSISFFDTDDYMRLVRIRDFFTHFDLSDNIIKRCNVPFGCSLHWTRFYDFFLIIPSYILAFFTKSIDKAIEYTGFFISPIVKIVTLILFFRISIKLFSKRDAFFAVALIATNPIISQFGTFGRPDHHAFIMLFMMIFLCNVISLIESNFKSGYIKLAISTAACIWISPETLIPLLIFDAILFLYAILDLSNEDSHLILKSLYLKNLLVSCFIGIIILPSLYSRFTIYYDEISVVHFALYICISSFFYVSFLHKIDSKKTSLIKLLLVFAAIVGIFLCTFPKFFLGMAADVSPFMKRIWLNKISEMKSPFEHGDHIFFISHTIIITISIANKIIALLKSRKTLSDKSIILWWILIVNTICYTIFSAFAYRMLPFSVLFGCPLIVDFGMKGRYFKKLHRLVRIVLTFFMATLFMFLAAYFNDRSEDTDLQFKKYTKQELFREIDNLSAVPVVIMAHSNDGPAILYYTKHSVVGAPYHRQIEGIIASYKIMEGAYNESDSKKILTFVNASYIFIKKPMHSKSKNQLKSSQKPSFAQMIVKGKHPKWITIMKLPAKFDDVIIAKIDKELMLKGEE